MIQKKKKKKKKKKTARKESCNKFQDLWHPKLGSKSLQ